MLYDGPYEKIKRKTARKNQFMKPVMIYKISHIDFIFQKRKISIVTVKFNKLTLHDIRIGF